MISGRDGCLSSEGYRYIQRRHRSTHPSIRPWLGAHSLIALPETRIPSPSPSYSLYIPASSAEPGIVIEKRRLENATIIPDRLCIFPLARSCCDQRLAEIRRSSAGEKKETEKKSREEHSVQRRPRASTRVDSSSSSSSSSDNGSSGIKQLVQCMVKVVDGVSRCGLFKRRGRGEDRSCCLVDLAEELPPRWRDFSVELRPQW